MSKRLLLVPVSPIRPFVMQELSVSLYTFLFSRLRRTLQGQHNIAYIAHFRRIHYYIYYSFLNQKSKPGNDTDAQTRTHTHTHTHTHTSRYMLWYRSDLMKRVVAIETAILYKTEDTNLIFIFTIFGILHYMPCLQKEMSERVHETIQYVYTL